MPELPEVQTTVNHLARLITGRVIASAWMDPVKTINTGSNMPWPAMARRLKGKRISRVSRRAKYIVIHLTGGSSLWIHQKMTGHLLVGTWRHSRAGWVSVQKGPLTDDPRNRHIRLVLGLGGRQLALSDARRFARAIFVPSDADIENIREISGLGPEPLGLAAAEFIGLVRGHRGLIKPTLMDPQVIAGIGNIYADEILHKSGIHPYARITRLTDANLRDIHRNMKTILSAAIKAGGSSTDDYRMPDGTQGGYQKLHRAYGRTGNSCLVCRRGIIVRTMRNGRSSHFCPEHQILPA